MSVRSSWPADCFGLRFMMQRRVLSVLPGALMLLASISSARAQSAAAATPQPHMIHLPRSGLVTAGGVVFGISYGVAFLAGLYALGSPAPTNSVSSDMACDNTCKSQGGAALIPVAGPLLATDLGSHNATGTAVALAWSGIQAAGLAMLIVGLIGHDVPQEPIPTGLGAKVSVVPFVTPEGGMIALRTPW